MRYKRVSVLHYPNNRFKTSIVGIKTCIDGIIMAPSHKVCRHHLTTCVNHCINEENRRKSNAPIKSRNTLSCQKVTASLVILAQAVKKIRIFVGFLGAATRVLQRRRLCINDLRCGNGFFVTFWPFQKVRKLEMCSAAKRKHFKTTNSITKLIPVPLLQHHLIRCG